MIKFITSIGDWLYGHASVFTGTYSHSTTGEKGLIRIHKVDYMYRSRIRADIDKFLNDVDNFWLMGHTMLCDLDVDGCDRYYEIYRLDFSELVNNYWNVINHNVEGLSAVDEISIIRILRGVIYQYLMGTDKKRRHKVLSILRGEPIMFDMDEATVDYAYLKHIWDMGGTTNDW
jgi:hypothetical protein